MFGGSKMPYPGMDPSLINFVNTMAPKEGEMPYEGQPIEFRKKMAAKSAKLSLKRPEFLAIKEHIFETPLGSVSARIYSPKELDKPGPCLVYMHGGGWIIGDLNSHDSVCVDIAIEAQTVVIALEYGLSPQHKFPFALDQCEWIFSHVYENASKFNINPEFLSIGGDSAGGNLALACTLSLKNKEKALPFYQFLIYPCIGNDFSSPSYEKHANAPFLDKKSMIWIWETYLKDAADYLNPLAFPLLEEDLSNLPQTIILNAELDPLAHEGAELAGKLIAAKVPTYHFEAKSLIHGFIRCRSESPLAEKVFKNICKHLEVINANK